MMTGIRSRIALWRFFSAAVLAALVVAPFGTLHSVGASPSHVTGTVTDGSGHGWPLYAKIVITAVSFSTTVFTNPFDGTYSVDLEQATAYSFDVTAIWPGYREQIVPETFAAPTATADFAVLIGACDAPGYSASALAESFDSATPPSLPSGWSFTWESGDAFARWATNVGTVHPSGTAAHSAPNLAYFNSYTSSAGSTARLYYLGGIDMTKVPDPHLTFWMYHDTGHSSSNDRVQPIVSTNAGSTWMTVGPAILRYAVTNQWTQHTVDLSAYSSNLVLFGFRGISVQGNDVHIDDVSLPLCGVTPGGLLEGMVSDANTGNPLAGTLITSDSGATAYSLTTPDDPGLADGVYELFQTTALSSAHNFSATGPSNYGPLNFSKTISNDAVNRQDLHMPAGRLATSPSSLAKTFVVGSPPSGTTLYLQNTGGLPLNYEIYEYDGGFTPASPVHIPAFKGKLPASQEGTSIGPALERQAPVAGQPARGEKQPPEVEFTGPPTTEQAYAFQVYPTDNLVTFTPTSPAAWTVIGSVEPHFFVGGTFRRADFSKMYVLDYYDNNLYTTDMTTAAVSDVGPATPLPSHNWTGMTDGMDGVLYASSSECGVASELYTIYRATGAATPLFNVTNATCLIDIAMNANGDMYGVDIAADNLVQINMSTGEGTPIGSLGVDANYAQGMAFERKSGVLYWAAYVDGVGAELRVIDTTTGASALVGALPDETDAMAFPTGVSSDVTWLSESPLSGTLSAGTKQPVTVTFTPPSTLGTYQAQLGIGDDTPYPGLFVPVTMVVGDSYLQGTVTGLAMCDAAGSYLPNAQVEIREGDGTMVASIFTDATGFYHVPLLAGSYNVTVTAFDYIASSVTGVTIVAQGTTTQDFTLRMDAPCISSSQSNLSASLFVGNTATVDVSMDNNGAGAGTYFFWERAAPTGAETNLLQDPSFELYTSSSSWQQGSTNFGTPLWSGSGPGPHTGEVYAWFGGYTGGVEDGYVKQTVNIPSGSAYLTFWLEVLYCNSGQGANDYMAAQIDGHEVYRVNAAYANCGETSYEPVKVDISAYANGASHEVKFFSHVNDPSDPASDFLLDDVAVESPSALTDVTWLSESPIWAMVPHDAGLPAVVSFNATSVLPGTYTAALVVEDVPKQTFTIPVTMTVGGAPNGLTAVPVSLTQINLHWNDNSSNEDGFNIEGSPDASSWSFLAQVGANVRDYPDTGLVSGTLYYYRVYAYRTDGPQQSSYSNVASAQTCHAQTCHAVYLPLVMR